VKSRSRGRLNQKLNRAMMKVMHEVSSSVMSIVGMVMIIELRKCLVKLFCC